MAKEKEDQGLSEAFDPKEKTYWQDQETGQVYFFARIPHLNVPYCLINLSGPAETWFGPTASKLNAFGMNGRKRLKQITLEQAKKAL